jgi:chromosome segregation ATPase
MEITIDSIIGILGLLFGGGAVGGIFTWRWQRAKAKAEAKQAEVEVTEKEAEAKSAEIDMAQKVQDTYQQILEDKQKEVEDNHRLIAELREDRDHYKQGYVEFRDQLDKLQKEFRDFRNETEEQRAQMKRDIARNGRQLECLRPFLCGREDCALRVPVTISQVGDLEKTIRSAQQKPQHDSQDISYLDPYNEG